MVSIMLIRIILFALAFCAAVPAYAADWLRAESDHYIVDARMDETDLRELVGIMEEFDRLLIDQLPVERRAGRKLHLHLDSDVTKISAVFGRGTRNHVFSTVDFAGGFMRFRNGDQALIRYQQIFYSQTAYFARASFLRTTPPWFWNGVPAVFSTTYLNEAGQFVVGAPDVQVPLRRSIAAADIRTIISEHSNPRMNEWDRYIANREIARPLLFDMRFAGQLEAYLDAYNAGQSLEEAAEQINDLDALADAIRAFNSNRQPPVRIIVLPPAEPAQITIRPLGEDEVALVSEKAARLWGGRTERVARNLNRLTQRYPESDDVWLEYAAAEYDLVRDSQFGGEQVFRGFGFSNGELVVSSNLYPDTRAWLAVNRALDLEPANSSATFLKAEILLARLVRSDEEDESEGFASVRATLSPFLVNPEQYPLAAALNYQSYLEEGADPPVASLEALGRAFVANPQVEAFRYAYASALARNGFRAEAQHLLRSLLNNPRYREASQRVLDQLMP
ncbi:MAG: hypothetical protein AAF697_09405 [Pseudomonadota bacterium]